MYLKTRLVHLLIHSPVEEHYLNARDETEGEGPCAENGDEKAWRWHALHGSNVVAHQALVRAAAARP